jgi:hypothetical protein
MPRAAPEVATNVPAVASGKIGTAQKLRWHLRLHRVRQCDRPSAEAHRRTVSFWVNLKNTNSAGMVGWGANFAKAEFESAVRGGTLFLWAYGSGNDWGGITTPQTNSWQYYSITWDGTAHRWYTNGSPVSTGFTNTVYNTTNGPVYIGYENDNSLFSYLAAFIDEVHIANTRVRPDGFATEFNNQNSPGTFYTFGSQQGLPASRLAITSVNGGVPPLVSTAFSVVIQAQDANGFAASVVSNTAVSLSLNAGTGALGGTLSGTLNAGTNILTVSGVTYSKAESGVVITATRTSGDSLASGNSSVFTVNRGDQTISFPSPGNQTYGVAPITLNATAGSALTVSYSILSGPASVSSNLLTITGAGSVTIQASQAGDSNWNAAPSTNQTISVAPKTVTGSVTISNKVYDATIAAAIATRSLSGVINGDAASLSGGTANFLSKAVGTARTAIATNLGLSGAQAGNYALVSTSATNTADITAKGLTVTGVTANNRPYNGTTNATLNAASAVLVGVIAGDTVNLNTAGAAGAFASKTVGVGKTVTVTGLTLTGSDATNYSLTQPTTTANITAATLTVSATGVNKVYDATTNATVTLSDNRIAGDALTTSYTVAGFGDKNVGTNKTVSVSGIAVSGADSGNYTANTTRPRRPRSPRSRWSSPRPA